MSNRTKIIHKCPLKSLQSNFEVSLKLFHCFDGVQLISVQWGNISTKQESQGLVAQLFRTDDVLFQIT